MQEYLDFFLRSEPNGPPISPLDLFKQGEKASGQDHFEVPAIVTDDIIKEVQDGITDPGGVMQDPPTEDKVEVPECVAYKDYYDECY